MNDSINRKEQGAPLVFDHVSVRYAGGTQRALDNVSVTAEPGKMTAVVGPNGSGKSSTMLLLRSNSSARRKPRKGPTTSF